MDSRVATILILALYVLIMVSIGVYTARRTKTLMISYLADETSAHG